MDKLGEELAPDSEVWSTYTAAASANDHEMIDGWNKGIDVLLIFLRDLYFIFLHKLSTNV